MICAGCVDKTPFLQHYWSLTVNMATQQNPKNDINEEVDIEIQDVKESGLSEKKNELVDGANCPLYKKISESIIKTSMFLPLGWRASLCKCPACEDKYTKAKVSFLTSEQDTVHHYESKV